MRVQSQHWDDYAHALATLQKQDLVYRCFCTRREIAEASRAADLDGAPLYPGTCAKLTLKEIELRMTRGEAYSWRLDMTKALQRAPGLHMRIKIQRRLHQSDEKTCLCIPCAGAMSCWRARKPRPVTIFPSSWMTRCNILLLRMWCAAPIWKHWRRISVILLQALLSLPEHCFFIIITRDPACSGGR